MKPSLIDFPWRCSGHSKHVGCWCFKRGFSRKQLHAFLPSALVSVHSCANFLKKIAVIFPHFDPLYSSSSSFVNVNKNWDRGIFGHPKQKVVLHSACVWIFLLTICFDDKSKLKNSMAIFSLNFAYKFCTLFPLNHLSSSCQQKLGCVIFGFLKQKAALHNAFVWVFLLTICFDDKSK